MKSEFARVATGLLGLMAIAFAPGLAAQEIMVFSTTAFRELLLELAPQFERASQHKVTTRFSSSPDILKRVQAGENADVVILASDSLEKLMQSGKVVAGSRVDVAKSGIGIAVRAGAPRPDISTSNGVKQAVLASKSVGYSAGASGAYIVKLFQQLGIAEETKPKSHQAAPGVAVGEMIVRGEVELGFHQISELLPVAGIDIVGPLPPDLQHITVFSAVIHSAARDAAAARALLQFLSSPGAVPVIRKNGMEP